MFVTAVRILSPRGENATNLNRKTIYNIKKRELQSGTTTLKCTGKYYSSFQFSVKSYEVISLVLVLLRSVENDLLYNITLLEKT